MVLLQRRWIDVDFLRIIASSHMGKQARFLPITVISVSHLKFGQIWEKMHPDAFSIYISSVRLSGNH